MVNEKLVTLKLPYRKDRTKTVRVFVPEHEENEKLPVIYMTDGQNLFEDGNPGQLGCWHTREAVEDERRESGRAAVIVGIHNDEGELQRTNELTPKSIGRTTFPPDIPERLRKGFRAEGEFFDSFTVNIVMPAIEKQFPVLTGREHTAFCGSSSGGLQSFYTAVSHPDKFGIAGVFSPAFVLYYQEDLTEWIKSMIRSEMPFLYIYSGGGDELEKQILRTTETVYDVLEKCYPKGRLKKVIMPDLPHHESAWEPIFRDLLRIFCE